MLASLRLRAVTTIIFSWCALAVPASAQDEDAFSEARQRLEAGLSAMVGSPISIDRVEETPSNDLIEVAITDGPVLYATRDGRFLLLNGDLLAVSETSVSNWTEQRRTKERVELISAVDIDDMIVFSPAEPAKGYINVFTDITCGYCRKLHLEMDDLNRRGVEVRYLAFPRGGLESDGARKLATAWCSRNRESSLTSLKAGVEMPINDCAGNPIAEHYALGNRLGVRGTPAIVTSDGQLIPGYRPAADIAALLGVE
ncbi:MAG: DsbC family protein [Proteobacteria bacterium]|nr:MAG: DsbC family protein [Pseudomonadota bacterium]